jgi:outer membrane protein
MRQWGGWGLLGMAATALAVPAWAADPVKIGVVDQQIVLERSKAGKRAMETLKEYSDSRQKIIAADDEELKGLEKELKNQEGGLSEAGRRDKADQFRQKIENYQRRIQQFNGEIQAKQKEMADEYMKKIGQVAADVAKKEGFAAVLDKGNEAVLKVVIYHNPAVDLTEKVIQEFDKRNK